MEPKRRSSLRSKLRTMVVCTIALIATRSWAATLNVGPGQPYTTIQAGINAANNGDMVLVAPGTYYEHISFKGKLITVTSSGGATATTIDGGNVGGMATVLFTGAENSSSILSGFTIRGGGDAIFTGTSSGGIEVSGTMGYVAGPSPIIENNIVTGNYCHNIYVQDGFATIRNNEISGVLQNTQGTGTQASYCTFGGAIYLGGTSNFQVGGNVVIGNTIENNLTGGSAISVDAAQDVLVMNNVIRNNYSRSTGSAFSSENTGNSVIVQNLIYGNTSTCGGAISFIDGIFIANNTMVDNIYVPIFSGSACTAAAQIYPGNYGISGPYAVIVNNVISGSTTYPAANCDVLALSPPSLSTQPSYQNNILYNAGGPFFGSYCIDVSHQFNNIPADPQFVGQSTGDYHLRSTSPAIDSGQSNVLQTFLTMTGRAWSTDFDGNPRVQDATGHGCTIDMGAYEYPGTTSACSTTETLQSSLNPSTYGQSVTFTAQLAAANGVPTGDVQFTDGGNVLATQTISGTGASTYTTSALTVGSHAIAANYQPTGVFSAASATLTQVVNGTPTTTTLICSPNPISAFGTATFAASVSSSNGTPQGGFTFTDNGAALAQFAGPTSGAAYTDTALTVGTHQIAVSFVPTGNYAGSSASCTEVVNALPTTATLTVTPLNSTYGNPVTLTANVAPVTPIAGHVPTGTVSFYYQAANQVFTALLGTAPLNAAGVAGLNLTTLQGGMGTITCAYSGDSAFAPSSCAGVTDTISTAASTLTLTSSLNPAPVLTPVTFTVHLAANGQPAPVGSAVSLSLNSQAIVLTTDANGNATYTTSSLPVGSDPVTASFGGSASLLASSAALTEVIQLLPTTTTLVAAPNPAYQGQTVTLTATVTAGAQQALGNVTFYDGGTVLGSAPLASQALNGPTIAVLTVSTLAVGTHPLTATYAAGAVYSGSTSAVVQEVVLPSSFTLALSPTSVAMRGGQTATAAIQLVSIGNFAGPVALTVGALPTYATATISPVSVTLVAAGTGASTLTIKTLKHAENIAPPRPGTQSKGWPAVLAATLLLLLPYGGKRRAGLRVVVGLLWMGVLVQGLTGCTNAYYTDLVVAPGSYPVTVTGTDLNGSRQSATLTVVITP